MRIDRHAKLGHSRRLSWPLRKVSPLWRKLPLLLVRYPGLFAPLAVGSLLLALTAAAHPLFVGATAGALLRDEISRPLITTYGAGLTYSSSRMPLRPPNGQTPLYERRGTAFVGAADSPLLGSTVSQVLGPDVSLTSDRGREGIPARLFAGTDAVRHVGVVAAGAGGPGAWLPDLVADALHAGPGDTVTVARGDRRLELSVAGVYRSLYAQPPSGYWLPWDPEIYPYCPPGRDCAPAPPQFILLGRTQALAAYEQLGIRLADFAWTAPLAHGIDLTREEAAELETFAETFRQEASDPSKPLGRILQCCTERNMYGAAVGPQVHLSSEIGHVVDRVEARLVTVEGPARLVQVVGSLVALAVLAGAAAFASSARTQEIQLLGARGHGTPTVAAKAAIENVAPSFLGGAVGVALAFALVGWIVPAGSIGEVATANAMQGAGVAVGASILIGSVVAAAMARLRFGARRRAAAILARVPWELAILALAFLALRDVQTELGLGTRLTFDQRPPGAALFLLPIATIGGFSVLGARLFRSATRTLSARSEEMKPSSYLAVNRLADSGGLVLLLFAAAGLSMGIFIHGQAVARSLADTVETKAGLFVGSDVQASVPQDTVIPADFPLPATKVVRLPDAGTINPGGGDFDLVGVDPATLSSVAVWRDGLSDSSLQDLVGRLVTNPTGPSPVIVVGKDPPDVTSVEIKGRRIETVTVGTAEAFPGMLSRRPTIVVDRLLLEQTSEGALGALDDVNAQTEIWVRGDTRLAQAALRRLPTPPSRTLTVDQVKDIPYISAVIDMFGILDAVGLGAAFLVVAALAMYLQARARSQLVAYGLSRRMGMSHRGQRRSLFLETASILASSSIVGISLALAVAFVLLPRLDPIRSVPPEPLFVAPLPAVLLSIVGIAAASWGAAWLTEVRARRAILGEVLRVDG